MSDWIKWEGGECPVGPYVMVDYIVRDEAKTTHKSMAKNLRWDHTARTGECNGDIMSYRISENNTKVADSGVKDTNPKAAIGSTALPMTSVSPLFCAHVALAKFNGKGKYGGSNFIGTEVLMSVYLDAIKRHFDKILMGEVVDEVDGVNHWGAIGANIDIILCAEAAGTLIDDRLRCDGQLEAYKALTPLVASLSKLHKDRKPVHYFMRDKK